MKTYAVMYVNGHPLGTYRITKTGSHFYMRKWRALDNARKLALDFYKQGKEVLLQEWKGDEIMEQREYK